MHIHLDMTEAPYLIQSADSTSKGMQVDTSLNSTSCSTAPSSTSAYPTHELTPYSAVSSFNLPAAADSTLLTPTSSSGSPSSRHHSHQHAQKHSHHPQQQHLLHIPTKLTNKATRAFVHSSPQTIHPPNSQQLTPPASSRMLYPYDAAASGQAEQPTSANNFEINNYIHTSPKDEEISPQMAPYYTAQYPIPGSSEDANNSTNMEYPFMNANTNGFYQQQRGLGHTSYPQPPPTHPSHQQNQAVQPVTSIAQPQHHQPQEQHGLAPILSHPHPSQYRPARGSSIHDYRGPTSNQSTAQHTSQPYVHPPTSAGPSSRMAHGTDSRHNTVTPSGSEDPSTPRTQAGVGSDMKLMFHGNSAANSNTYSPTRLGPESDGLDNGSMASMAATTAESVAAATAEAAASVTTNLPHVTLSDKASNEEQCLFQLHQQFKGTRGKGMWDAIANQYAEKYPGTTGTARLQMKFTRAFRRYVQWPESEKDILLQAYREDEAQRFSRLNALMKEKGGGKVWDWKPVDVEMMLVRLGLEEPLLDETTKLRRRRRSALRRQSQAVANHSHLATHHQDPTGMMSAGWSNGYSPVTIPPHTQYSLPPPPPHHSAYEAVGETIATQNYPPEQENQILDQLERKYDHDHEIMESANGGPHDTSGQVSLPLPNPSPVTSMGPAGVGHYGMTNLSTRSERVARETYEQLNGHRIKTDPYRQ